MTPQRKLWLLFTLVQIAGAAVVIFGAAFSALLQITGLLLLLPGSFIAAIFPLKRLWHPALWSLWQTDSAGLSNLLYLPATILLNALIWWGIRSFRHHKLSTSHS